MALTDYRVTDSDVQTHGVQGVSGTKLTGTAQENKARFDQLITAVIQEKLNGLIDELVVELAQKLTAPTQSGSPGQFLQTDGMGGWLWATPSGAGDMLQSAYDSDGDGTVDAADTAAACSGQAAAAAKLAAPRALSIQDADGSHTGAATGFDGSADAVLKLPATIKAGLVGDVTGNLSGLASSAAGMSGGVLSGKLFLAGSGIYGAALPADDYTAGRLFFKKV